MNSQPDGDAPPRADEFARAAQERGPSLVRELLDFLRENHKWWLAPIVVALLLLGGLVLLNGTALAPFLYTLW